MPHRPPHSGVGRRAMPPARFAPFVGVIPGTLLALALAFTAATAAAAANELVDLPAQRADVDWPTVEWPEGELPDGVDRAAFGLAVDALFEAVGRSRVTDTRALLVVQGGWLVFERYADGFDRETRFQSWSMAKSFTQALVGLLVRDGRLDLDRPAPVPAWRSDGDPRGGITLRHLLQMTAGIDNGDGSGGAGADSFAARLLFGDGADDTAAFGAAPREIHSPGAFWAYSTGTSAVVAGVVGRALGPDRAARSEAIRRSLFAPLGMDSALFGFDAAGTFLGGSHFYANARDYARFGLLYLRGGVWEDRPMLPDGWVDFTRTPAPAGNNGAFGAHFWLNLQPKKDQFRMLPGGPASAFAANGNSGQTVLLVPTRDLIVVRLGEQQASTWTELNENLASLVDAFPDVGRYGAATGAAR